MKIITITDEAKTVVAALLNKSLLIEYDFILNYPRIIDYIVNYEKIKDEMLIKDLDKLGRDSLSHFSKMESLLKRLGSEPAWQINVFPRIIDVFDILEKQLEKEKNVHKIFADAKKVTMDNKVQADGREFFGKFIKMTDGISEDVITADEIINTLDRLITDEQYHIRIVENSIATLKALVKK